MAHTMVWHGPGVSGPGSFIHGTQHAETEACRTGPRVLFANLFTSMFNDCEISKPLIQQARGALQVCFVP